MSKIDGKIAARYAKALFELCSASEIEVRERYLEQIASEWNEQPQLSTTLSSPLLPLDQRTAAAREYSLSVAKGDNILANFVATLVENKRADNLPEISKAFSAMVASFKKIFALQVSSALPLTESERHEISEGIRVGVPQQFAALVSIDWELDSSLIGGMVIRSGDKVLDGSVGGALDRISRALLS